MELTNCKQAPTPKVAGSVKHKLDGAADLDMQECRLYRAVVGSLQHLSVGDERLRKGDEATDRRYMDTTETASSILGRNQVSESRTHETWNRLRPT